MNNQKLFQETFSKITLSEEKRKELIDMGKMEKPKRKFHVTKAAAASIAIGFLVLAGGSAAYATDGGKIFNNLGNWLKCSVTRNGEEREAQVTEKEDGTFVIKYGTEDDGGEFEIDGNRNTSCMEFEINYEGDDGRQYADSYTLTIDESLSRESQLWDIREQLLPRYGDDTSSNHVTALTQAAEQLDGVWKEGVLLAAADLRKIRSGRKIAIIDYDFNVLGDGVNPDKSTDGISWLLVDYTDVKFDEQKNAEFTQMSTGGYITEFRITFENGEIRSWRPVKK